MEAMNESATMVAKSLELVKDARERLECGFGVDTVDEIINLLEMTLEKLVHQQ